MNKQNLFDIIKPGDKIRNIVYNKIYIVKGFYDHKYGVIITDSEGHEGQIYSGIINRDYELVVTHDNVNHPKHYTSHPSGIECIEITRHYCFSIGNAIKYLWRAGLKKEMGLEDKQKEIEDLEKAIWYINDRIKQLKND